MSEADTASHDMPGMVPGVYLFRRPAKVTVVSGTSFHG